MGEWMASHVNPIYFLLTYLQSAGFAFEAQNFPDASHHPDFPSSVLRPGETYRQTIDYKFSAS
jgi:aldose 1-epimerase